MSGDTPKTPAIYVGVQTAGVERLERETPPPTVLGPQRPAPNHPYGGFDEQPWHEAEQSA
jgi:hypothetical protein